MEGAWGEGARGGGMERLMLEGTLMIVELQPHSCHGLAAPHLLRLPRTPSIALGTTRDAASILLWAAVPKDR